MPKITVDISKTIQARQAALRKAEDEMKEILGLAATENRDLNDEEIKNTDALAASIKQTRESIKRFEILARGEDDDEGRSRTRGTPRRTDDPEDLDDDSEQRKREVDRFNRQYSRALRSYLIKGESRLTQEEREILHTGYKEFSADEREELRQQSSQIGVDGGFLVPPGFVNDVEKAMKDESGILGAPVDQMTTGSGADLPWPTSNDTDNEGEQIDENEEVGDDAKASFGQVTFKSHWFSSKVFRLPFALLQDSAVNIEALVAEMGGQRIGRIMNRRFTLGNGANQPMGLFTAAPQGEQAASNSAISYDDIIKLYHSVPSVYRDRPTCGFMFNDATGRALSLLKDTNGRQLWQESQAGMGTSPRPVLYGKPVYYNCHAPSIGAGQKSVVFGDLRKYKVRRVREILVMRLNELYARRAQVGFLMFSRADGRLMDAGTGPVKALVHP